MSKLIAVLPVFNEEATVLDVLQRASPCADLMVLVNDGSKDRTGELLRAFARRRRGAYVLDLPGNRGMAGALEAGFRFVLHLRGIGMVRDSDAVATLDADGQHEPEALPAALHHMERKKADVVLARRDFSAYPAYKVWGNRLLTAYARLLSGHPYADVECGFRLLRVRTLAPLLRYYTGVRYSCAQEIALISARLGYRVDNTFLIRVPRYRAGTTVADGFVVAVLALVAAARLLLDLPARKAGEEDLWKRCEAASRALWPAGGGKPRAGKKTPHRRL